MRIKLISCVSTMNEVRHSGIPENFVCEFLDYTYHAKPARLHKKLQELIDNSQEYELIIITYSRCSNAVFGLVSKEVPLLLPNTHDCIGLMLGSNERHLQMLKESSSTYYFSQGWLDYGLDPYAEYEGYVQKYGQEKAIFLIEALYGHYDRAVFIRTPGIEDIEHYRTRLRQIATFFKWQVAEVEGDIELLSSIVQGIPHTNSIYVEPGQPVTEDLFLGGSI